MNPKTTLDAMLDQIDCPKNLRPGVERALWKLARAGFIVILDAKADGKLSMTKVTDGELADLGFPRPGFPAHLVDAFRDPNNLRLGVTSDSMDVMHYGAFPIEGEP